MSENQITQNEAVAPVVVQGMTPNALLALAIQKDIDLDRLTKLMDLQERWEKNEAKKAYVAAMTAFKKDPPKIIKDMHVEFDTQRGKTSYNHASLGNVVATLTEVLSSHDLSAHWNTKQENGSVSVTCSITHVSGHSESITLQAPPDNTGSKNSIQQIGSTITYLQRYTLLAICGLATNEFENDGNYDRNGNGKKPESKPAPAQKPAALALTEEQRIKFTNLVDNCGLDDEIKAKMYKYMKTLNQNTFDKGYDFTVGRIKDLKAGKADDKTKLTSDEYATIVETAESLNKNINAMIAYAKDKFNCNPTEMTKEQADQMLADFEKEAMAAKPELAGKEEELGF